MAKRKPTTEKGTAATKKAQSKEPVRSSSTKKKERMHDDKLLPTFRILSGYCLGHKAYRGFGSLSDLASISQADIFDQQNNPTGTQRNLNRAHARKAYTYVTETPDAFYPEIILNIRDASYVEFELEDSNADVATGTIKFVRDPSRTNKIVVSRLDGNHRLWFADGREDEAMDPIDMPVSFCFVNLPEIDDELKLFRDINDNQMGMNTSHLKTISVRLLGEAALKVTDPALYIVQKLHDDSESPFYEKIHQGGKIRRGATLTGLTVANLRNAVHDMLTRSAKISQFPEVDAQYEIIKNYWQAIKKWLPEAWKKPSDYIIFKGVGLYAVSYLGVEIIDRCLIKGKYEVDDMFSYLKNLPDKEVFSSKGGVKYAGRSGGRLMAADLAADLEDEGEVSMSKLQKMILGGK